MSHSSGASAALPALGTAVSKGLDLTKLFTSASQSAAYARARPGYPNTVLNLIANNLIACATGAPFTKSTVAPLTSPSVGLAVDVGCGSGQLTTRLAGPPISAKRVLGTDPSEAQLSQAAQAPNVSYLASVVNTTAASIGTYLASLPSDAVAEAGFTPLPASAAAASAPAVGVCGAFAGHADLVTVAQAFHWFDYPVAFGELHRVLSSPKPQSQAQENGGKKSAGLLAIISYDDPVFENAPLNRVVVDEYRLTTLGPYWPGRRHGVYSRCGDFLDVIDKSQWRVHRFVHGDPRWVAKSPGETGADAAAPHAARAADTTVLGDDDGLFITKEVTLSQLVEYFKSSSAYVLWRKAHTRPAASGEAAAAGEAAGQGEEQGEGELTAPDPLVAVREAILALYPGETDPLIRYNHPISVLLAQPIE